jgi:hypothetical protein
VKKLGKYQLGCTTVIVYTDHTTGNGRFCYSDDIPEMVIGTLHSRWDQCLEVLLHEALEFLFSANNARYLPDVQFSNNADAFLFLCNHSQFSEIVAQVANFTVQCSPDLAKRYNKCSKRK